LTIDLSIETEVSGISSTYLFDEIPQDRSEDQFHGCIFSKRPQLSVSSIMNPLRVPLEHRRLRFSFQINDFKDQTRRPSELFNARSRRRRLSKPPSFPCQLLLFKEVFDKTEKTGALPKEAGIYRSQTTLSTQSTDLFRNSPIQETSKNPKPQKLQMANTSTASRSKEPPAVKRGRSIGPTPPQSNRFFHPLPTFRTNNNIRTDGAIAEGANM